MELPLLEFATHLCGIVHKGGKIDTDSWLSIALIFGLSEEQKDFYMGILAREHKTGEKLYELAVLERVRDAIYDMYYGRRVPAGPSSE